MNFISGDPEDCISLPKLRDTLIRLEDTIIFALIERAQYSINKNIYVPGMYKYEQSNGFDGSFLEYFLSEVEKVHGDDQNYGSAATRDVECLQALSQRIHYGKFVAEAKFRDPETEDKYIEFIKNRDVKALETLLTNKKVEDALLRRLRRKALIYGQDITEHGKINLDNLQTSEHLKIKVDVVVELYEKWVIPLTKQVEIEYLLIRLDNEKK
ncbi:3766_t:CDS:2 [Funneliformis caledonium]|uniref:Chorismate mutase n=1 Tax=Funneliformis caledonium TaxID=1117310 RepID=A0A9N9A631_9GLOM|nr:3766_t:CDS:2 [Funneliformis caledonium]